MSIATVHTDQAPKAIGPYSQAATHGDLIFTAGQIALDPATMELVPGGVAEQTERVLANLKADVGADFIDELIEAFLEDAPGLIAAMQAALAQNDADAFRRAKFHGG